MEISNFKKCYIISFWLGERRRNNSQFKNDKLFFLKKQIEVLQTVKHNLNKIILNFNVVEEDYPLFSEIFELIPKSIQGADVEINIRENYGMSYGAWSDLFEKYKSKFDYYIFAEDDYFFIEENWDEYLVRKHNSYPDCGYLCMMVREPHHWTNYRKIAGSSVGIASSENLMKVFNKYGRLPSLKKSEVTGEVVYDGSQDVQNQFGFAFLDVGLNIYDVRDDYKIMFSKGEPPIDVWFLFNWNKKFLNVSEEYFNQNFTYYMCFDLEFKQEFEPSTFEEAMSFYDKKVPYFIDGGGEDWRKRKLSDN